MNLAVNAGDAMPAGGQVELTTANVELDARYADENPGVAPGRYVRLEVTDTGIDQVRDVALAILRRHGYAVIAACDGDEAWRACQAHPHPIHLLLTDLVMPGITGRELAGRLHGLRPEMKVLCMSGYHDAIDTEDDPDIAYLQKPFTATALATAVRRALDAPASCARQ
jgi:DNA-binding NtrC family response regulator